MSSPDILIEKLFETLESGRHQNALESPQKITTPSLYEKYQRPGYEGLSQYVRKYVKEGAHAVKEYFLKGFGIDPEPEKVSVSETEIDEENVLGRYTPMINHMELDIDRIRKHAKKEGINEGKFISAVAGHEYIHAGQKLLDSGSEEGIIYTPAGKKRLGSIGKILKKAGEYGQSIVEGVAAYISNKLFGTKEYPFERKFVKGLMEEHGEKNIIRGNLPENMAGPVINLSLTLPKLTLQEYRISYRVS